MREALWRDIEGPPCFSLSIQALSPYSIKPDEADSKFQTEPLPIDIFAVAESMVERGRLPCGSQTVGNAGAHGLPIAKADLRTY